MNTERKTQIRNLLAKNPQTLENAIDRLQHVLADTVADLYLNLFDDCEDDQEGLDIINEILIESLKE